MRLGHRYFQVSSSAQEVTCTTARACTRAAQVAGMVYEEPVDPPTTMTCQTEAKIKDALSPIMKRWTFWTSSETSGALVHSWGSRSRANVLRAVFHDAQDY